MAEWVEDKVSSGEYGTASEVVRDALRSFRQREVRDKIDEKLIAALQSGKTIPATKDFWRKLRKEGRRRLSAKKRK